MRLKKISATVVAATMASVLFVMPVSACGGHHRQARAVDVDTSCPVCTVEGCAETGRHTHDGAEYCGYDHAGGYCDHSCETVKTSRHHGRHHH